MDLEMSTYSSVLQTEAGAIVMFTIRSTTRRSIFTELYLDGQLEELLHHQERLRSWVEFLVEN